MRVILYFLLLLLARPIWAQTVISGKLIDEEQQPIPGVSVIYKKVGATAMNGFGRTDTEGLFKLQIKLPDADSIQLDFNHMSYAKKTVVIANQTAHYSYVLQQQARQIEEVKVADIPVYRRKDTINYAVDAFTSKQDRVIGDIIKKLPGIEMRGNQILYQGKPIQKYMVNNLDLMGGRYGMINNNLPADAVRKVQVVENDQPIKILDSLVFSDRASLNLELKKFTSTGTGRLGIGLSPALWDVNLTPMTFGKTFQMLNSFQSNNTGHDAAKDLRPFYTGSGFIRTNDQIKDGPSYIYLRNVASPGFDEKKWLDNKIFLLSSNMLQKLANGLELKGNISYYDDTRQRQGFTATQYYTSDEIIYNTEAIDNRYRIHVLDAGILLEKNEKNVYLRNSLKYHKRWNSDQGSLFFNDSDLIAQKRDFRDEALLNALSLARFIGKQLVNINSTLEWHRTPQQLSVSPGQFSDILHNAEPYEQMAQHVHYDGLRWDNNLSFTRRHKLWTFSPSINLDYNRSHLDTYIRIEDQSETSVLGAGYLNDMHNSRLSFSPSLRIGWENAKWKWYLTTPFRLHYFNVTQQDIKTLDNTLHHTFNPATGMTYVMNSNNELSANLSIGKEYGGLDNFYNGYIIGQYRSMQRYDARLLRTDSRRAEFGYNYKNTLKANFANLSYAYAQNDRDYIFTTQIDSQGRSTTAIANRHSANDSHQISGGVSRFFASVKTVAKLNGSLQWSRSDYLLNDILSKQYIQRQSATLEIINSISAIVSGDYKTTIGHTKTMLAAGRNNHVFYNNHYLNLMLHPHDKHSITFENSFYKNNIPGQDDQFFIDATYRYRVDKWKTDIALSAQNLLNNNAYTQQFSNNIELVQSYFELRPRQFVISTRFKF